MIKNNIIENFNIGDELEIKNGDSEFKVLSLNKGLVIFEMSKDSLGKVNFIELNDKLKQEFLIRNGLDTYEVDTVSEGDGEANPANTEVIKVEKNTTSCIDVNKDGECD